MLGFTQPTGRQERLEWWRLQVQVFGVSSVFRENIREK